MTFKTRTIRLVSSVQIQTALALIPNLPVDADHPLEIVIRESEKPRTADQNALMWAALEEIAAQAWVQGRQHDAEVWHEHCKREFLPENFEEKITRVGYRKWAFLPNGERQCVGSTTMLTRRGFSDYIEQIYAFGASLGVEFRAAA